MIDLRNTCVLVRTKEENEMLLKEAEKQGFRWYLKDYCEPLQAQCFPDILKFYEDKDVTREAHIDPDLTFYEASELLGIKEMTAREFIENYVDMRNCKKGGSCSKCVLWSGNTKFKYNLCDIRQWEDNIDELFEIVKSGKATVPTPEEKAVEDIEKFIENPDRAALNDEFVESLKLVVEKSKEVKQMNRLTLDEAIKHAKEVADMNYNDAEKFDSNDSVENYMKANCMECAEEHMQLAEWLEELKSYKELEEQGLLMKLPVPLGTTVYTLSTIFDCIYDYDCKSYQKWKCKEDIPCEYEKRSYHIKETEFGFVMAHSIGETVFLTRKEAEKKLEELKNEI